MNRTRDQDGEDFLSRWSRRKQDAASDGEPEASAEPPAALQPQLEEAPDERSDEEILEALGLKHPDQLRPGDDVKGFMEAAVPDRLRRMALRQLWRGNPALANLDGLVDYGEDFTDSATVVENLQTLYQVGKGMFREPAAPEVVDEVPLEAPDMEDGEEIEAGAVDDPLAVAAERPEEEVAADIPEPENDPSPVPRRMVFRFDD